MMRGIFTLVFCLAVLYVSGQTVPPVPGTNEGDYYSGQSGLWNSAATWYRWTAGAWVNPATPPTNPALAENITIANGHTVTLDINSSNDRLITVDGTVVVGNGFAWSIPNVLGTTLTINGTVDVNAGGFLNRNLGSNSTIIVNGTLKQSGVVTNTTAARMIFNAGAVFDYASISGTTLPTATWNIASTCRISGVTGVGPAGLTQSFGNFEWNTPGMITEIDLNGTLQTVRGNFSIVQTNGNVLYLSGENTYNLNVGFPDGGNMTIGSSARVALTLTPDVEINVNGNFTTSSPSLVGSADEGNVDMDISGNVLIGAGTFDISQGAGQTSITLGGNYTKTGGLVSTSGSPLDLEFDGTGQQIFTSTTVPAFPINYSTANTSNLTVAPTSHLSGPGSLNIAFGTSLTVTNTTTVGALRASTTLGNVRVPVASRTYSGTIVYGGTARQYMYADTPDAATTIANASGVDLRQSVVFSTGLLTLQTGLLRIANNTTITVENLAYGTGSFGYNSGSSLVLNGSGNVNLRLVSIGGTGIKDVTINRLGTVTQTSPLRINGTLALNNGTLAKGASSLQLFGPVTAAAGAGLSSSGGGLYVRGSGALPISVPLSGTVAVLEMLRTGETFTPSGALTITRLNLYAGNVAAIGGAQMANAGLIVRTNGFLTAAIGAAGVYNVQYTTFSESSITTGFEIPASGTALNTLTINNTINANGLVALDKAVVAAGQIRVWRGELHTNNFNITTGGNFRVDATGRLYPGRSTFTFNGSINQSYASVTSPYTPYRIMDIIVNKTGGSTFTLSSAVNIRNRFAVNTITTVAAGTNLLTLLSDADSTAFIPTMPGAAINNRGRITGSVIVQRYLPNTNTSRQYRYLSSPTTTSRVSDWQNEIPITGSFTNPSSGTFDGVRIISKNPSMFYYNEPTGAYVAYPTSGSSTVASIVNGRGYAVFGRTKAVTPLTLDSRGTLGQWDVNVPVTNTVGSGSNGFNLVGNPYPAPIDWDLVYAGSLRIGATITLTDNNHNATTEGTITYNAETGIAVPPDSFNGVISMGQAFWVTANAGAQAKQVQFREAHKVSGQSQFIREGEPDNLLRLAMTSGAVTDHLAVVLLDSATDGFDNKYDGYKFETTGLRVSTLSSNNDRLVINALGKGGCEKVVPIDIADAVNGSYTFTFTGMESFDADLEPVLYDKVADKLISLSSNPVYNFSVSDAGSVKGRFELRFAGPQLNTQLEVSGETTCVGNSIAVVTLASTQAGVQYTATLNGTPLSAAIAGNGGELQIPVSVDALPQGATEVAISAQRATCGVQTLSQKATITVLAKPAVSSVSAGQVCGTGTASLSAAAVDAILYNWYEGADDVAPIAGQHGSVFTTPVLNKTKTFFVAAVNAAGCEGERIEVKANVLDFTPASIMADGNMLSSNYESGNQWYLDGSLLAGETGKSVEALSSGVYTVVVNTGTCTTTSEGREMVILGAESTDSFIHIYPNPAPDKVHVELRQQREAFVELISTTGVQLRETHLSGSDDLKTATFDINSLPDGMYLVRIKTGNKTFTKKILKAK